MAEFFSVLFAPELFPIHVVFMCVFGLLAGSFLNVCIYRIPAGMSIVHPGSHCTECGYYLKWYDNVPILSYLLLGGQCRRCGSPFSPRYMLVELLTGALFVWLFWVWRYNWATPLYLVFTGMLIVGTFTDIDHWIIPDSMTWGGAALALAVTLPLGLLGTGFHTARSGPFILEGAATPPFAGAPRPANFEDDWVIEDEGFIMPPPAGAAASGPNVADPTVNFRRALTMEAAPDAAPDPNPRPAPPRRTIAAARTAPGPAPDVILLPFGLRFDARLTPLMPLANALVGAVFGFGLLWSVGFVGRLAFRKEAMGMGDMKLFAFIGAVVGWFNCLWVLVLACVLGIVFHVSIYLGRGIAGKSAALPEGKAENTSAASEESEVDKNPSAAEADAGGGGIAADDAAPTPDEERERRVLDGILKQEAAAEPSYHPLPFGPYIAMAAFLVLLYSDQLNAFFRKVILQME